MPNMDRIREIRDSLFAIFSSRGRQADKHEFGLYYGSRLWETYFQAIGEGLEMRSAKRAYYGLSAAPSQQQLVFPSTWRLRKIDETMLAAQDLENLTELLTEIHSESTSPADFLSRKFGYCMQEDSRLIGWCLSEYNHGDRCEVGIETLAAYQRRGVASSTASALIVEAIAHGITTVGWHCWRDNSASSALARKLGGVLTAEYSVLLCRF
jgi:RimJ/RimL family protein N-acetyltransferase